MALSKKAKLLLVNIINESNYDMERDNKEENQIIEELRSLVCDELIANGLDVNDVPTEYGLELEQLIDELGHYIVE